MKKTISILLAIMMLVSCLAFSVSAAADDFQYGSVDGKPGIEAGDARLVLRYSVGLESFDEDQLVAADVDGNNDITAADARLILRASVGLENSAQFGVNGSQVFTSGHFVLETVIDAQEGTAFTISRTAESTYLEATMEIDMSDGSTNTGKPVRIGFLTLGEDVYWVLPDIKCYLLIDDRVTNNMGISADMFKEFIPDMLTGETAKVPDEISNVTINSRSYLRYLFLNDDGTSVAHDMRGITLKYLRTFDADGNETAVMNVKSISANVPDYQRGLPAGSTLYATKPGSPENDISHVTAFLFRFAALANIDITS